MFMIQWTIKTFAVLYGKADNVFGSEQKSLSCNLINCFAGFSDFAPCTLDQWIKMEEEYS